MGYVFSDILNCRRFSGEFGYTFHHLPVDAWIPFKPSWVWVYLFYYPVCFFPLLLRPVRDTPSVFLKTATGFGIQFFLSCGLFLLLPFQVVHPILPAGLSNDIITSLYKMDMGFNSFPSLHVANITFVSILFWRFGSARWARLVTFISIAIACSTLFVKQHYVVDVLFGALLGWGSDVMTFQREKGLSSDRHM